MRIGLAQINTTVGDLVGNRRKILDAYNVLVSQGAELVLFPELVLTGYPPRDLLFKRRFVPDNEQVLQEIASAVGDVPALIGFVEANPAGQGRAFFNAAAFCHQGKVRLTTRKCLLPTYDVFDEDRYFEPASAPGVVEYNGLKIGITICEDIWTHPMISTRRLYNGLDPVKQLAEQRCDLMLNLSASPWHHGKGGVRQALVTDSAKILGCPVAYVNAVGGNDELIFDGRSVVADADGCLVTTLSAFSEELRVVDIAVGANTENKPVPTTNDEGPGDIYAALVLGLRDYAFKSGFKKALIALSGGIDSAVVGVIAAEAFGPENVIGVSLPSSISSHHSRSDARALAENLKIRFETIAIADSVSAVESALAPVFAGRPRDVTEENIQARVRGVLMMALSQPQ